MDPGSFLFINQLKVFENQEYNFIKYESTSLTKT